ncbi:MAG: response regulator [Leptolyngbya sp. SIO3F4]|nr:response regulator [Leptolyngbya sp. SIO3F4]
MSKRLLRSIPHLPTDQPPCRILVADDHPVNRTLLIRLLQRGGFVVNQAVNGADAFAVWQQWHPQLIFMDLLMPGTDGREAARLIRAAERLSGQPTTKIIALTAEPVLTLSHQATAAGFDSIIAKPIRPDTIFDLIAKYLNLQYVYGSIGALEINTLT